MTMRGTVVRLPDRLPELYFGMEPTDEEQPPERALVAAEAALQDKAKDEGLIIVSTSVRSQFNIQKYHWEHGVYASCRKAGS